MSKHNVVEWSGRDTSRDELTELDREGAGKLIREALEAEVSELLSTLSGRRDASSRAAVVRNGYQPARDIQTGIGPVTVKVPKMRSRDGKPVSFRSALVPPYVRKSASLEAALPWLYLKGISTAEMAPVLEVLVGAEAKGLSASSVWPSIDFPATHWQPIRTRHPIESAFATIRLRTNKTRGCVSRQTILSLVFQLGHRASKRWRRLRGFKHRADVVRGVRFENGVRAGTKNSRVAA